MNLLRKNPFEFIITDMTLPKMTGIDFSRKLLQICPNIPVILCSGIKDPETEAQAKSLGIKAYLTKPLTRRELAGVMRELLGKLLQQCVPGQKEKTEYLRIKTLS